ncbi:hypothetical protein PsorP6_007910 [Peronosclerospora sorghi]|uniref:Uncharacterized protein n=1 Tax=Peronosclerospora sorghi TaxID=230839 RepID=A0ACC0WAM4_9STRA|nr:hypothetical protein PsorP6_007910 [Peronosclerospora sorghi]
MSLIVTPRKDERFTTIADAIAAIETYVEHTQQRRVRIQQPKGGSKVAAPGTSSLNAVEDESVSPSAGASSISSNTVVLECENAPACKWFVRLLFVKGESKWKISSMNMEHHRTHCLEDKRAVAMHDDGAGTIATATSTELPTPSTSYVNTTTTLAPTCGGEAAAAMGASVYAGMVFADWKDALSAVRTLADQMGRRSLAEKVMMMPWKGKNVMARRVVCQNHRNSSCGWMVVLGKFPDDSERYTVLSMSLLHSKECLETCNFNARKRVTSSQTEANMKAGNPIDPTAILTAGPPPGSSLLVDDISKYQLTHEMRWSTGKEATKAIGDFALVVQRKRSMLCKRNNGGSNKKYVCSDEACLWFVQLVKGWKSKTWKISAMNLKHSDTCTGAAKPTARQLAEMRFFRQAVITHSKSSGKLLTDNFLLNSESGIKIPRGMAYRAQRLVVDTSTDDITESYKYISSLLESFAEKNPGSIAEYEKDPHGHFIRAFIMPNASTAVLAGQQQILGIHVLHYKTVSFHGCMALLVTQDGNFEYQVLAFALLPASDVEHMKWFLSLVKRGGVRFDGNPLFCSHSEHGLLRALAHDACNAKIMFSVRCLLNEMAHDKNIPALGYLEEKVWELQRQESEDAFLRTLGDLEAHNAAAAAFLRTVHPKNWAFYLNRSIRLYGWASTGGNEAITGSDIERSDEAPFDLLYTFVAFLMDGVFKKSQLAEKLLSDRDQVPSFLTPGADRLYRQEMQTAGDYTVRRCDEQVAFAWLTGARPKITYRMDLALRTCTCGKMFQLGLPCCHFIAASMHFGNEAVLLESIDTIYKATTYAEINRSLRLEIPIAGDLRKDHSLLPAISARSTKCKKRPRRAGSSQSVTPTGSSAAVLNAVSSTVSVSSEDASMPLAKSLRLDFDADVVNSLGEIV